MAIITPALYGMERFLLLDQAYAYADAVLTTEGIDPLQTFHDTELQRHHYAVASEFQKDVSRLQTLASLAFTDRNFGSDMLTTAHATDDERIIAKDFNSQNNRLHSDISSVCKYIVELKKLGGDW